MAKRKQGMETMALRLDRKMARFYNDWAKRARVPTPALIGIVLEVLVKVGLSDWRVDRSKEK